MLNRREWLNLTLGAGAALTFDRTLLHAQQPLITRAIPSSGEKIPVVGLGSSATFSSVARSEDVTALREVLKAFTDQGGTVFDTAPSYGASEEVAGRIANELGITDKIFWATKVNVAGRGGGGADPAAAQGADRGVVHASSRRPSIDLIQVHNLGDIPTQLGILKELKKDRSRPLHRRDDHQQGAVRGTRRRSCATSRSTSSASTTRSTTATWSRRILPLAQERKIGVLVYVAVRPHSLFKRVGDRPVPDFAKQFEAATWGQFFLKFVVSHPAVTCVHAGDEPGQEHDRQPRRRPWAAPGRGDAQEDGRVHRGAAQRLNTGRQEGRSQEVRAGNRTQVTGRASPAFLCSCPDSCS